MRKLIIAFPVLVMLGVIGVVGFLTIADSASQVEEADEMAARFQLAAAGFRSGLKTDVEKALEDDDPAAAAAAVGEALENPPVLEVATDRGREGSRAYREAARTAEGLTSTLGPLKEALDKAAEAQVFIDAANKALALRLSDYLPSRLTSVAPVRNQLIPAFESALREFEAVRVPEGQAKVAQTVSGALRHVLEQSRIMVARGDAGQSYSFTYTDQLSAALEAVRLYEYAVDGEVTVALDAAELDR